MDRREMKIHRSYLATDPMEMKERYCATFGDRVVTPPYEAWRNTSAGVQEGLVELYALSHTARILGSYGSSYSRAPAELGRIRLLNVRSGSPRTADVRGEESRSRLTVRDVRDVASIGEQ
jgi:hypothetical protein